MYSTAHRTRTDRLRRHSRCRRRHRRRRHRPTNRRARFLACSPCPGGRSLRPSFLASLFLFPLLSFRLYLAGEAAPLPDSFPLPPSLYPGLHAQCQAHGHRIPPVRPRVPRARGVASLALPSLALATPFHVGCWTKRRGRFFVILPLEGRCMLEFCGWDGIWATIQVRNSLLAFREKGNRQGRPRRSPAPAAATARDGMGGGGERGHGSARLWLVCGKAAKRLPTQVACPSLARSLALQDDGEGRR